MIITTFLCLYHRARDATETEIGRGSSMHNAQHKRARARFRWAQRGSGGRSAVQGDTGHGPSWAQPRQGTGAAQASIGRDPGGRGVVQAGRKAWFSQVRGANHASLGTIPMDADAVKTGGEARSMVRPRGAGVDQERHERNPGKVGARLKQGADF